MNKNIPKIAMDFLEYIKPILNTLKNPSILLYGSSAYGKTSSDLDICFIVDEYSKKTLNDIKLKTIQFQLEHNMVLDTELPYENKLIYTYSEIDSMLIHPPFNFINGKYELTPIQKNKEYMHSEEMKYRLLFNILTVRSILIFGDEYKINEYKKQAFELLVKIVISYNELSTININEFINLLYNDYKTGAKDDLFLGYKTNIPQKQIHLIEDCTSAFMRLVEKDYLINNSKNIYSLKIS